MTSDAISLVPGDLLKIEQRYVVDGVVKSAKAKGRFAGVQVVGTAEHLVLRAGRGKTVRLFPLHSISEITLVKPVARIAASEDAPTPRPPAWDPGIA